MDDIESTGTSFALVHHGGAGEDALLGDTLVQLAEQIAEALECSECCIYEYIASRGLLRAQALWSRVPNENDIDWVGEAHSLADAPGFRRVIEQREVLCSYPDDEIDAATAGFETMEFWGERAAIWAPIVVPVYLIAAFLIFTSIPSRSAPASEPSSPIGSEACVAAQGLVQRLLPDHADRFTLEFIASDEGRDVFELETRQGQVVIRGNSGVSMAMGLNWYLKHYCRCHVSWCGQQLTLPDPLPAVEPKVRRRAGPAIVTSSTTAASATPCRGTIGTSGNGSLTGWPSMGSICPSRSPARKPSGRPSAGGWE